MLISSIGYDSNHLTWFVHARVFDENAACAASQTLQTSGGSEQGLFRTPPTYDDSSGPRRKERVSSDYWHLTESTHLRANKKKHDVFTGQANADVLIDLARRGLTGDERTVDDEIADVE